MSVSDYVFKIVLVGGNFVGKSCVLNRFLHERYQNLPATIGMEFGLKTIQLDGKEIKLVVWDTGAILSWDPRYDMHAIHARYFRGAHAAMIVYDALDYNDIQRPGFFETLARIIPETAVKMLISNKCDVAKQRAVSSEEGKQFAINHGIRFMEVSAKSGMNLYRAFVTMAREILIIKHKLQVIPREREFLNCCEIGDFASIDWEGVYQKCDLRTFSTPFDYCTPLHYSCLYNNLDVVKCLIEKYRCSASCKDHRGENPLHWAIENNNIDIVEYMVSGNYARPSDKNLLGQNAIHYACKYGHSEILSYLLPRCSQDSINEKDTCQRTALHWACISGCVKAIKVLITHLDPNEEDKNGHNCLQIVYSNNTYEYPSKEIIEYLTSLPQCDVSKKDENGRTCLHWATEQGHIDVVKYLVSVRHCDPNERNKDDHNCLHIACKAGQLLIVRYLINWRLCNPNDRTGDGCDCLHVACRYHQTKIIDYFVSEVKLYPTLTDANGQSCLQIARVGISPLEFHFVFKIEETISYLISLPQCSVNEKDVNGETCLHWACRHGLINVVKYLVSERKCDPNVKNRLGQSSLQIALQKIHDDRFRKEDYSRIVKFLSEEKDTSENDIQSKWLHWACRRGYAGLVKYFIRDLQYNSNEQNCFHAACEEGHTAIVEYLMMETQCNIQKRDKVLRSGLHVACASGCLDTVKLLTRNSLFDLNEKDVKGENCLHLAYTYAYRGTEETVNYLIALPHCNVHEENRNGETCLHWACRTGHLETTKYLISERQCNPANKNLDGQNCFHIACRYGKMNIVTYLLKETCINVQEKDVLRRSGLHLACANGHCKAVQLLMEGSLFDLNEKDKDGQNCLHLAYIHHYVETVNYLITLPQCNVYEEDKAGETCLHWACRKGFVDTAKYLISRRQCNPASRSRDGQNCLHIACRYGKKNIVTYLLKECHLDVQEKDSYGRTCLHWTCENGNVYILRTLLLYKFDLSQEDFSGKTPLQLTQKKEVITELVRLGADPADEYKNLLQSMPEPSISLFIVGSPSAGKTTLVESLTNESSGWRALLNWFQNVNVEAQTAGIIPTEFESKIFGRVTFFDLAGQKQYYASHAAVLQKSISSAPPIIFLVIKLCRSEEEIRQDLLYWFHFLENLFKDDYTETITKPHLFIIGSHADQPQALPKQLWARLFGQEESNLLRLIGYVALDCRKAQSTGIAHLRQSLRTSCDTLRMEVNVDFRCHCFLVLLIDKFRERSALCLHEILTTVRNLSQGSKADTIQPYDYIPYSPITVSSFCDTLNARGDIFFLKNEANIENSWIILKKDALLHEVLGTVFAPHEFKQYQQLASSTGVVPLSKLAKHFADHDTEMLVQFLCYLEFCHEIDDPEVLAIICKEYEEKSTTATDERYLFFPSLVTIALPDREQVQGTDSEHRYCCGWMLQCADPNQFFTPRFLQVILLRLAFSFALAPSNPTVNEDIPVLKRKCSVWTNGIHWVNDDGVYTLFEVDDWGHSLTVLIRCLEGSEMESVCIRSAVIQKVLAALYDFCPQVLTLEYFIHPCDIQYPLKSQEQIKLFDIKEIATSVVKGKRAVVNDSQDVISITELLYFEPYTDLGKTVLLELFDEQNPVYNQEQLSDHFVYEIANKTESKFNHFKKMLTLPLFSVQFPISHCSPAPAHAMVHLLLSWREGSEGTRHCLRSNMDVFSVFAGRNPLVSQSPDSCTCVSKTIFGSVQLQMWCNNKS